MTQDARHYAADTAAPAPLPADSDGARPEKAPGLLRRFWSFFSPTIIACGAILLINQVFLFYAVVPTGSMKNLIMEGSYILANRLAYAQSEVQHGDVIVFSHEGSDMRMKYLVKRVIGIAGDTIELRDGDVYRNGEKLDESAYVLGRTFPRNSQTTRRRGRRARGGGSVCSGENDQGQGVLHVFDPALVHPQSRVTRTNRLLRFGPPYCVMIALASLGFGFLM